MHSGLSGGLLEIAGNILCLVTVNYAGRRFLMSFMLGGAGVLLLGSAALDKIADSNQSKRFGKHPNVFHSYYRSLKDCSLNNARVARGLQPQRYLECVYMVC